MKAVATARHAKLKFLQAKSEEEMIKFIKEANTWASGIILNLGSLTHESGLIQKAIKGILIPTQEIKGNATYQAAMLLLIQKI